MALLFIAHDVGVTGQICDRIAVPRRGEAVEEGPAAALFQKSRASYTRALPAAAPGRTLHASPSA